MEHKQTRKMRLHRFGWTYRTTLIYSTNDFIGPDFDTIEEAKTWAKDNGFEIIQ